MEEAEFRQLIAGIQGDCDKCAQDCRDRQYIMDSQLRVLNEIAERLANLEVTFENVLNKFRAVCQVCSRLNILCSNVGNKKGTTHDGEEKDIEETLPDWC